MIRLAIIAGAITLLVAPALLHCAVPSDLQCYLVQMHIHAHTNHNGTDLPASMEWHCAYAREYGFDVVWWSDHAEVFDTYQDMRISFGRAMISDDRRSINLGITGGRRPLSMLAIDATRDGFDLGIEGARLNVGLTSRGSGEFDTVRLTPASRRGPVKTVRFCRPVTSGLRFVAVMDFSGPPDDSFLRFGFDLAAHPEGRHHLLFDIVRRPGAGPRVIGDTLVVDEMLVEDFPARLSFDLERTASHLPDGYDNTLGSVYIEFGARNGATVEVAIDSLIVISDRPDGSNQYRVITQLADRYESRYGIAQYVGVEASGMHTPECPHMNAFFPESTETLENLVVDPRLTRAEWARGVERRGGLVSLNHPFGAALNPVGRGLYEVDAKTPLRELSARAGPIPEEDLWAVAAPIIESDGMGCRIMEVGYLFRGSGTLADHLKLWDLVLANGVRLVGNGVSDAHGGIWGPDMRPNPFATWIWAEDKDRDSLLEALRAGRVFFGNPFLYQGEFMFGVNDVLMGDTLYVRGGEEARGWVRLETRVDDLEMRLVHVKLGAGREARYISRDTLVDPEGGFSLVVNEAGLARIEVYGHGGEPVIFSNPVWLIPR
ncbi:MAG: hypothetical protein PVJ42_05325 [bacterium]